MENIDVKYICTVIGNMSGIPIRIFSREELIFFHSVVALPKDPMEIYRNRIFDIEANVGYFVTKHFNYYGIVNSGDIRIVIGPTRQTENSIQELRELAFRADVLPDETADFIAAMKSIYRMPLDSVLQILCAVNYILNGEKLELKDITICESEQDRIKLLLEQQYSKTAFSSEITAEQRTQNAHATYALEQQIMKMVSSGETSALKEWAASAPAVNSGILAAEQLRQAKNTLVVLATLTSRAAIQGGLSEDEAFLLSDQFIQRCERFNTLQQITNLQYNMVLEFAERVERIRSGGHTTQLTLAVKNYIRRHLSERISVEDIAKELYMSRPYLSAKFRKETGETLTDFILKEKTEEAKRLLRYSDKSLAAISSYLGFSSQSHFSRIFKKYAGKTPSEYTDKYQK